MIKVKCLREITIPSRNLHCLVGKTYELPADIVNGYDDCFKKMRTVPQNKSKKTEENK